MTTGEIRHSTDHGAKNRLGKSFSTYTEGHFDQPNPVTPAIGQYRLAPWNYNGVNLTSSSEDEAKLRQVSYAIDLCLAVAKKPLRILTFPFLDGYKTIKQTSHS